MPIYEYRREDGTTFEVMQSMSDAPLEKDPETGQKVVRVLHAPAIHFKGSGFYNTDYGTKRRNREKAQSDSSSDAKPAETKSESKTDSKKTESKKPAAKSAD